MTGIVHLIIIQVPNDPRVTSNTLMDTLVSFLEFSLTPFWSSELSERESFLLHVEGSHSWRFGTPVFTGMFTREETTGGRPRSYWPGNALYFSGRAGGGGQGEGGLGLFI